MNFILYNYELYTITYVCITATYSSLAVFVPSVSNCTCERGTIFANYSVR